MLDNFFDRIVCLCYEKRYDQCTVKEELRKYGGSVKLFLAGKGELVEDLAYDYIDEDAPVARLQAYNYAACVRKIIMDAKRDGISRLLFLEDDAEVTPQFEEVFQQAITQLMGNNVNWDVLFLGANHTNGAFIKVSRNVIQPRYSLDLHAVAFKDTIFDAIIQETADCQSLTLDGKIADLQKNNRFKFYAIHPSIVVQKPGWSFNENRFIDKAKNYWTKDEYDE